MSYLVLLVDVDYFSNISKKDLSLTLTESCQNINHALVATRGCRIAGEFTVGK